MASSNKALAAFTSACHIAITCNGATPSETVFPPGLKASQACRQAVSCEPQRPVVPYFTCGAGPEGRRRGRVCVAGQLDVVIADDVIGQQFAPGSPVTDRVFSTNAGIRFEAASLTTAATHHLLTELLVRVARAAPARRRAVAPRPGRWDAGAHVRAGDATLRSTPKPIASAGKVVGAVSHAQD